ncbi:hypothetical protein KSF78_0008492 [Schistosoma japonicum]|nr:hypothetical protein KSF78_0008492 [Schistosoma japonicum]
MFLCLLLYLNLLLVSLIHTSKEDNEMNHAIASENRTINKYKDCQSEHFKAKNGLNFLQYGQAFLLDIKATYDKPTINQLQGLESCLDAQHQDFLRMESENSEEYCNTLGTPFSIGDVDFI